MAGAAVSGSGLALARLLEDAAAVLHDPDALRCAARVSGSVPSERRLTAARVLAEDEGLSALERVAVVDGAARWLDEDAGGELAHALVAEARPARAASARAAPSRSDREAARR
jgi:hypothetical protein